MSIQKILCTNLETTKETIVAKAQGGAQRSKVIVREYPSVPVRVGKYALNLDKS